MLQLSRLIGRNIRRAREESGLTQVDLGRRMNRIAGQPRFSASMVSLLESGQRPIKVDDIMIAALALEVPAHVLVRGTPLEAQPVDTWQDSIRHAVRYLPPRLRSDVEALAQRINGLPPSIEPVLDLSPSMTAGDVVFAAGYTHPPVDPTYIAQKAGITVMQVEIDPSLAGLLVVQGDRRVIAANLVLSPERQRLSVAYELAHYVAGRSPTVHVDANLEPGLTLRAPSVEENRARAFAVELLLPATWLKSAYKRQRDYDVLASRFGVSSELVWARLVDLGLVAAG